MHEILERMKKEKTPNEVWFRAFHVFFLIKKSEKIILLNFINLHIFVKKSLKKKILSVENI